MRAWLFIRWSRIYLSWTWLNEETLSGKKINKSHANCLHFNIKKRLNRYMHKVDKMDNYKHMLVSLWCKHMFVSQPFWWSVLSGAGECVCSTSHWLIIHCFSLAGCGPIRTVDPLQTLHCQNISKQARYVFSIRIQAPLSGSWRQLSRGFPVC